MPRPFAFRHSLTLLALACAGAPCSVLAETHEAQGWLTEAVAFKADDRTTVTLDFNQRARPQASGNEQYLQRLTIERRIAPGLKVGGGMLSSFSDTERELRAHQQVSYIRGIWDARTRLEQRFFDHAPATGWRLRQRMQLLIPLNDAKSWSAVVNGEAMFHLKRARASDTGGLAVLRSEIGLRRKVSRHLDIQLTYLRQQNIREDRPDRVAHAPWLRFNFSL